VFEQDFADGLHTPPRSAPAAENWFSPQSVGRRRRERNADELQRTAEEEPSSSRPQPSSMEQATGYAQIGGGIGSATPYTPHNPLPVEAYALPVEEPGSADATPANASPNDTPHALLRVLYRARSKRPSSQNEKALHAEQVEQREAFRDVIDVGPFSKGLMTFGGRLPNDVYNAMRSKFVTVWKAENAGAVQSLGAQEKYKLGRQEFAKQSSKPAFRKRLLKEVLQSIPDDDTVDDACKLLRRNAEACLKVLEGTPKPGLDEMVKVKANVLVIVYNDPRYIMAKYNVAVIKNCLPAEELVVALQAEPEVQRLLECFFEFVAQKATDLKCEWAASVEVSPKTYWTEGVCRLHLSVGLGRKDSPFRFTQPWKEMFFNRTHPTYKPGRDPFAEAQTMKKLGFAKCFGQAAYYHMMPKILKVASAGSKQPFTDFPITQTTITSYLQAFLFSTLALFSMFCNMCTIAILDAQGTLYSNSCYCKGTVIEGLRIVKQVLRQRR